VKRRCTLGKRKQESWKLERTEKKVRKKKARGEKTEEMTEQRREAEQNRYREIND